MRIICGYDEAIDHKKAGIDTVLAYMKSRNLDDIKPFIKPGQRPTYYTVAPIPGRLMDRYVMAAEGTERLARAFQCGIRAVEPPSGQSLTLNNGDKDMADEDACYQVEPVARYEIGAVVLEQSFLAGKTGLTYKLLPLSLDVLGLLSRFPAAKTPANAPTETKPGELDESTPTETNKDDKAA